MDDLQTRLEALEQQMHTVYCRLRWWRGLACGLAVVGMLSWGLPLGLAREDGSEKDKDQKGLAQRVAALEKLLKHFSREGKEITITGANLHIVNGLGSTLCPLDPETDEPIPGCPNGVGNLIVGYNELRNPVEGGEDPNARTGSHNIVVGEANNFSRVGGLVVGAFNEISGDFAVVSGGIGNTASGPFSSVSGGGVNTASGHASAVSGGIGNTASGEFSSVSGGGHDPGLGDPVQGNMASGRAAVVSGGDNNTASGDLAVVSGGSNNTASGNFSSVSGGRNRTAEGEFDWVAGTLFEDE
jgi:trimeric autotransporter adhesin